MMQTYNKVHVYIMCETYGTMSYNYMYLSSPKLLDQLQSSKEPVTRQLSGEAGVYLQQLICTYYVLPSPSPPSS